MGCTCIGEMSLSKEFKISNVILVGKVISKDTFNIKDTLFPSLSIYKIKYQVLISRMIKGKIKTRIVSIISGIGNGDCGFSFEVGKEYLIYSTFENRHYRQGEIVKKFLATNICTRTKIIDGANMEIENLIKIRKHRKNLNK